MACRRFLFAARYVYGKPELMSSAQKPTASPPASGQHWHCCGVGDSSKTCDFRASVFDGSDECCGSRLQLLDSVSSTAADSPANRLSHSAGLDTAHVRQ